MSATEHYVPGYIEPGWYVDPLNPTQVRYHNGVSYTAQVASPGRKKILVMPQSEQWVDDTLTDEEETSPAAEEPAKRSLFGRLRRSKGEHRRTE